MKKLASILMVLAIMFSCLPMSVSAAEPPITFYTSYGNSSLVNPLIDIRPNEVRIVNGAVMVDAIFLYDECKEGDYNATRGWARFEKDGEKWNIDFNKGEVTVNGDKITFKAPPFKGYGTLLLEYTDAARLMNMKATIRTATLSRDYTFPQYQPVNGKWETVYKKGTTVRYIDFMPKLSKEYSEGQLKFMQGISAPLLLHNLYNDSTKIDVSKMKEKMACLNPYFGYTLSSAGVVGSVEASMQLYWGITDRDSLLKAIKGLIESGKNPANPHPAYDFSRAVQLSQWGCKADYITADEAVKYGMQAAGAAQKTYSSWKEFGEDYLRGYATYGGSGGTGGAMYKARKAIVDYTYKDNKFLGVAWK